MRKSDRDRYGYWVPKVVLQDLVDVAAELLQNMRDCDQTTDCETGETLDDVRELETQVQKAREYLK